MPLILWVALRDLCLCLSRDLLVPSQKSGADMEANFWARYGRTLPIHSYDVIFFRLNEEKNMRISWHVPVSFALAPTWLHGDVQEKREDTHRGSFDHRHGAPDKAATNVCFQDIKDNDIWHVQIHSNSHHFRMSKCVPSQCTGYIFLPLPNVRMLCSLETVQYCDCGGGGGGGRDNTLWLKLTVTVTGGTEIDLVEVGFSITGLEKFRLFQSFLNYSFWQYQVFHSEFPQSDPSD